jgi:hypothetical protein
MSETNPQPLGPAFPAVIYKDHHTIFTALQAHARAHGFAIVLKYMRPNKANPTTIVWTCDKAGTYNSKGKDPQLDPTRRRQNTASKKTSC